jgi:nitrite reductase (NADH) large subunit
MPASDHYVIIGNGPAGNRAADTLREGDPEAGITIVSDESTLAYHRHRLTGVMAGNLSEASLTARDMESYRQKRIRLRVGNVVERIDPATKTLFFSHMETLRYTRLVIASGSRPVFPENLAPFSAHIGLVGSLREVRRIRDKVKAARSFFILGGDLVGFDVMNTLRSMGKSVTFLLQGSAFWPFTLDAAMTRTITENLAALGVTTLAEDTLASVEPGDGGGYRVTTTRGVLTEADMLLAFPGLAPCVDFARGSGIDTDHGILVDEHLRTNLADIYACGSCAQIFNPDLRTYSTSVGWCSAVTQGEVAARNLLGEALTAEPAPVNLFDVQGVKVTTTWWDTRDLKDQGHP